MNSNNVCEHCQFIYHCGCKRDEHNYKLEMCDYYALAQNYHLLEATLKKRNGQVRQCCKSISNLAGRILNLQDELARYKKIQEECGYDIGAAVHLLSGDNLRLKEKLDVISKECGYDIDAAISLLSDETLKLKEKLDALTKRKTFWVKVRKCQACGCFK